MKPLTNSDSASDKSNGALYVSPMDPIKNIINTGNRGTMHQICNLDVFFSKSFSASQWWLSTLC